MFRLIGESRRKDDRLDAQTLARLARIDPQSALSGEASQRESASGSDPDPGASGTGASADGAALVNTARGLAKSYLIATHHKTTIPQAQVQTHKTATDVAAED